MNFQYLLKQVRIKENIPRSRRSSKPKHQQIGSVEAMKLIPVCPHSDNCQLYTCVPVSRAFHHIAPNINDTLCKISGELSGSYKPPNTFLTGKI